MTANLLVRDHYVSGISVHKIFIKAKYITQKTLAPIITVTALLGYRPMDGVKYCSTSGTELFSHQLKPYIGHHFL